MEIKEFEESHIDYPGKTSAVVFTGNCNYRCPACHAKYLLERKDGVSEKEFFDYLDSRKDWIDAVVLCGGEPTLEKGLEDFAGKIKKRDLAVKLDTNGSNPDVLRNLLDKNLIDYVAMDVKGPKNLYAEITGKEKVNVENVEDSMKIVQDFSDYEFRTTVAPIMRYDKIGFMSVGEAEEMVKWIIDVTGENKHKHYLQKFVPRENGLIESMLEDFLETPGELLNKMKMEIIKYLPNCEIRDEE